MSWDFPDGPDWNPEPTDDDPWDDWSQPPNVEEEDDGGE